MTTCGNIYYLNKDNEGNDRLLFKHWHELDSQIPKAEYLSIDECLQAIDKGLFDPYHDELHFRQKIWWSFNDRVRDGKPLFEKDIEHEIWHENLEMLLKLLDVNLSHHRIMTAEIYRNRGEFDAAIDILSDFYPKDQVLHKEAIISKSNRKNKYVVRVDKFLLTDKTGFKQEFQFSPVS